jgi:hypothetical protein
MAECKEITAMKTCVCPDIILDAVCAQSDCGSRAQAALVFCLLPTSKGDTAY